MYNYALRCLLIAENIYCNTFVTIEKYMYVQLAHFYLETKNYRECIRYLKVSLEIYMERMEC
jgi:hypothetical protein